MSETVDPSIRFEYVETNGIRLHVAQAGPESGPLVLLLHGFPELWRGWRRQIPALVDAGYRVWAPDQRGYNLSDKPKGVVAYNIDLLADDVVGLMDAAGVERAVVVGHDWGAAVAWWTALRHPQRVEKLVILNVPHPSVMRRQLAGGNFAQLRKSWYMFFFQIPWLPETLVRLGNWRSAVQSVQGSARPGTFSDAEMDLYRAAWSQPGAMTGMINWYRAIMRVQPQRPPKGYRITPPTLIIWGAQDAFLGRELVQPSLEMCEDGRTVFIEEATHWVQHEEPARVNELLLTFLDGAG